MNRYFFDLRDEDGVVADEQGVLLPSLEAVQDEAARAIGDLARDEVRRIKADASEVRQLRSARRYRRGDACKIFLRDPASFQKLGPFAFIGVADHLRQQITSQNQKPGNRPGCIEVILGAVPFFRFGLGG